MKCNVFASNPPPPCTFPPKFVSPQTRTNIPPLQKRDREREKDTPLRSWLNLKHAVLYAGHMYKPFWITKIWPGWQGVCGKVKIWLKIAPFAPYGTVFWLSLTPTADPVKSLGFKMVCTCVSHILLHVFSSTSTSWGYFRPQKSILAKIAILAVFRDFS